MFLLPLREDWGSASNKALALLDDPRREFASSVFVQLEVLPKAIFNGRSSEANFYHRYFDAVSHWATSAKACDLALEIAAEAGLNALDALHVAAAVIVHADQIVTTERTTKPMHRTKQVKIISIE